MMTRHYIKGLSVCFFWLMIGSSGYADPDRLSSILRDPDFQAKLESLLRNADKPATATRTRHTMIIVDPPRDMDYTMMKVAPDRRVDHQIMIVDPTSSFRQNTDIGLPGPPTPGMNDWRSRPRFNRP